MPNYEYHCLDCGARFEVYLAYSEYGKGVACPRCHRANVRRIIGRVALLRSGSGRVDRPDPLDPNAIEELQDNPQELGRLMRSMGDDLGEDLGPEFDDVVDRLAKGQTPEEIEQALPDIGGEEGVEASDVDEDDGSES